VEVCQEEYVWTPVCITSVPHHGSVGSYHIFEFRYKQEFSVFYDFLCGFYDMHKDEESYFWNARKILRSEEGNNHAFLQLIAGGGTTADEFVRLRRDSGELFQLYVDSRSDSGKARELQAKLEAMDPEAAHIAKRAVISPIHTAQRLIVEAQSKSVQTADSIDDYIPSKDGLSWVKK
jgi:hypothetical protein